MVKNPCEECGNEVNVFTGYVCKFCSRECYAKNKSRKLKGTFQNQDNPMWKGNNVTKHPLHIWIKRRKPKTDLCENCGIVPPYDLANISGEYKRDVNDFKWLCRSCHMKEDGRMNNLVQFHILNG